MRTLGVITAFIVGLAGFAYGVNAEHSIQESARKEAEAWAEVRKLEHQLLGVRLEVQDCERRLYLTEKEINDKFSLLAMQRCRLLPGTC